MFLPGGAVYVYRSYGIHWCLNIVCDREGVAGAVLVRALQPTQGLEEMRVRRGVADPRLLCSGPGRLCQALAVTREHDGLSVLEPPFELRPRAAAVEVVTGPRIGITKAVEQPWRYGLAGSPFRQPAVSLLQGEHDRPAGRGRGLRQAATGGRSGRRGPLTVRTLRCSRASLRSALRQPEPDDARHDTVQRLRRARA